MNSNEEEQLLAQIRKKMELQYYNYHVTEQFDEIRKKMDLQYHNYYKPQRDTDDTDDYFSQIRKKMDSQYHNYNTKQDRFIHLLIGYIQKLF